MKKVIILIMLILFSVALGYSLSGSMQINKQEPETLGVNEVTSPLMKIALVADSENDNQLLIKALSQIKVMNVNFVIGLGDWSQVGTVSELEAVKVIFDNSGLQYFLTPGDHDLWDNRNRNQPALLNYQNLFGKGSRTILGNGVVINILDDSDIYKGISQSDWDNLNATLNNCENNSVNNSDIRNQKSKLCLVFAHKTPFHPDSAHILGEDSSNVALQAKSLLTLLQQRKVSGFFSGDLHFFAQFKSPDNSVRIVTVGAVASERNFQGPRFAVLTINNDYTWSVEDIEIK